MEIRKLYATNRSLLKYVFKIIEENNDGYTIQDISTTSYELSQNKFYLDKTLNFIKSENPNWAFIFREDEFFISFDEEEVKNRVQEYRRKNIEESLEISKNHLAQLESDFNGQELIKYQPKNLLDCEIGDIIYFYDKCDDKLKLIQVQGKITFDNSKFFPILDYDDGINQIESDEDGFCFVDENGRNFSLYSSPKEYENFLQYRKQQELIKSINKVKNIISKREKQLKDLNI